MCAVHLTLVQTHRRSSYHFDRDPSGRPNHSSDLHAADTIWIAHHQGAGRNVYFEVNETPARCARS